MAKALFGHLGGSDPRMAAQAHRLRQRIRDLGAELARLQADNDALAAKAGQDLPADGHGPPHAREPALT